MTKIESKNAPQMPESPLTPIFLTANWRYLAIVSWDIDPVVLQSLVPAGTSLDSWNGHTFVSIVGFLFLDTRVMGLTIPFHRNFEEINLRFYVRREAGDEVRRGVVFVKEIVPRPAIALAARLFYNESYVSLPTSHTLTRPSGEVETSFRRSSAIYRARPNKLEPQPVAREDTFDSVRYTWRFGGRAHCVEVTPEGDPQPLVPSSEEEFIAQHYWGYARQKKGGAVEYRVAHPAWRAWQCRSSRFECDVEHLYGEPFAAALARPPSSAFLAEGSAVAVHRGRRIA